MSKINHGSTEHKDAQRNPKPLEWTTRWKTPEQHAYAILAAVSTRELQEAYDRVPAKARGHVRQLLTEIKFQRASIRKIML